MLERLKSPVVLGVIIGGALTLLQGIHAMANPTWYDIAIAVLAYAGAVVAAINNPTEKTKF